MYFTTTVLENSWTKIPEKIKTSEIPMDDILFRFHLPWDTSYQAMSVFVGKV